MANISFFISWPACLSVTQLAAQKRWRMLRTLDHFAQDATDGHIRRIRGHEKRK
ncbi:hypothetical protein PF008_g12933 [Phytophthora fragariae]|uniref:Uncharacterized protein n=1 Tax=Phytophthora fragariae TaxID=53985 RepID=A0A6G0RMU6_9STRA|nr:hypothetical protein PF008_g12933 [Phytophthora fragariae]